MKFAKLIAFCISLLVFTPVYSASTIYIYQNGGDVVAIGSGSVNTTSFNVVSDFGTASCGAGWVRPNEANLCFGSVDNYYGISGPSSFGTASSTNPDSLTGDAFGLFYGSVAVPSGYISGAPFSGTATWNSKTIADLNMTPGSYTYTWGSGSSADSLVVYIGIAPPFIVTASAGANGTLNCTSPVTAGNTTTCTATPASGYRTLSISGCGGTATSAGVNTYTTGSVNASCTVTASFTQMVVASIPTLGEWGMIFMASLMAMFGIRRMRRSK